jgi:hypothetical protein
VCSKFCTSYFDSVFVHECYSASVMDKTSNVVILRPQKILNLQCCVVDSVVMGVVMVSVWDFKIHSSK